jgi:hypothetical protein
METSLEAFFHRQLKHIAVTKKQQGYIMGAFREAYRQFEEANGSIEKREVTEFTVEELIDMLSNWPMDKKISVGKGIMEVKE